MFTHSKFSFGGRAAILSGVTALTLAAFAPQAAVAGQTAPQAKAAASGATDFSAQRRHYRGGGGGAAAAAAFAGIVGTGLAIAAAQNRYDGGPGYYGGGPAYYDGGPGYYGGGPGYGYYGSGGTYGSSSTFGGQTNPGNPRYYGY